MATVEQLLVQINADVSGLKKEMRNVTKSTDKLGKQTKKLGGTFKDTFANAAKSAAILDGPLGGVAGRLGAVSGALGTMNPLLLAGGVAVTALTAGLVSAVKEAGAVEQQLFKLEALVKSTGGAAGKTAGDIDNLARSIARNTLASSAGVRDAAGVLLTFKAVSGPVFERTLVLAQDMAAVMGTDIKGAALQLAKALEDPTTGLTALRRSGVSFTAAEKDMIKAMFDAGKVAEAQGIILDKLHGQLGGAGKAEGKGLSGAVDLLGQNWEEMLEAVGNSGALDAATKTINNLAAAIKLVEEVAFTPESEKLNELLSKRLSLYKELNDNRAKGRPDDSIHARLLRDELENIEAQIDVISMKRAKELSEKRKIAAAGKQNIAAMVAEKKAVEDVVKAKDAKSEAFQREMEFLDALAAENIANAEAEKAAVEAAAKAAKDALSARNEVLAEGLSIMESVRTPLENYNAELARLDTLLRANAISQETWNRAAAAAHEEYQEASGITKQLADAEEARNKILEDGAALTEELRTPLEKYNDELFELNEMYQELAISEETFNRALARSKTEFEEATEAANELDSVARSVGDSFADAFKGAALEGKGFSDVLKSLEQDLLNTFWKEHVSAPISDFFGEALGSMFKEGLGSIMSFAGGGFTGFGARAGGVDGRGGSLAVVHPNETVVDHTRGGSVGNTINFNITTPNADSFRKSKRQLAQEAQTVFGGGF